MSNTTQTVAQLATGATYGGGLAWLTTNSSALTALAVIITALASLYYGYENKKSARMSAEANKDRNTVNRRDITAEIIAGLRKAGKSEEYIKDLTEALRK